MFSIYILLFVAVILLFIAFSFLISNIYGAPVVGSQKNVIIKALELAKVKPKQKFIDFGCGYGQVLDIAKKKFNLDVSGCEISPFPYIISRLKHNKVYYKNIFDIDLNNYNIIYVYLYPRLVQKLEPKLIKAIQSGVKVITISFGLKTVKPKVMQKFAGKTIKIY